MGEIKGAKVANKQPLSFFWYTLAPLFLMVSMPSLVIFTMAFVVTHKSSAFLAFKSGCLPFFYNAWTRHGVGTMEAWAFAVAFTLYSALSIVILPGKKYLGPPTSSGYRPVYWRSGITYYVLTMFIAGFTLLLNDLPCYPIYRGIPGFAAVLSITGFIVSGLLYVKGRTIPSPGEHGPTGSVVFDFYWGLELYPRIGERFDFKMWTNCRFGMMMWQLLVLVSWKAQAENTGWNWAMAAMCLLPTVYTAKFFCWEDRYMQAMDATTDRSGYYLSWGTIAFSGPMYAVPCFYMVENSPDMSPTTAVFTMALGVVMIMLACWCDYQKKLVRDTQGNCTIWGSTPKMIRATYQDSSGKDKSNLLLVSGFWAFCRRPSYVFEILIALCWVLLSGHQSFVPYLYLAYLVALLVHRTFRIENICANKYGQHWKHYCSVVKYRMVPYVF